MKQIAVLKKEIKLMHKVYPVGCHVNVLLFSGNQTWLIYDIEEKSMDAQIILSTCLPDEWFEIIGK